MKQRSVWFLLIVFIFFLLLAPVYGQKITGTISGTVTDPTGAMVPDATVTISNSETGLARTTTTNSAGEYTAPTCHQARIAWWSRQLISKNSPSAKLNCTYPAMLW